MCIIKGEMKEYLMRKCFYFFVLVIVCFFGFVFMYQFYCGKYTRARPQKHFYHIFSSRKSKRNKNKMSSPFEETQDKFLKDFPRCDAWVRCKFWSHWNVYWRWRERIFFPLHWQIPGYKSHLNMLFKIFCSMRIVEKMWEKTSFSKGI